MAKEQSPQDTKLPQIKPNVFIKYRHIYKEYLTGRSINSLVESFRTTPQTIRKAIEYMTKYVGTEFTDEAEIEIAKGKAEKRCEDIRGIYAQAMEMKKHSIALKCIKELRNEEELIYNLKGLLGIKLPELGAGKGSISLILPVQLGINKRPRHMENVTPEPKQLEVKKEEIEIN